MYNINSVKDDSTVIYLEAIVVVIVLQLDLSPLVQSVPIITNVVNSNPIHGEVYVIQHYVIKFVSDRSMVFSGYFSLLHQ
jgi:hypothetical protein